MPEQSNGKGIKFALLGLLAVALLGGIALTVWKLSDSGGLGLLGGPKNDGPEVSDVGLLPANVQMVMSTRLAELYALPAARDALEKERKRDPKQTDPVARMERDTGLKPEQVDRLHVVGLDLDKQEGWLVCKARGTFDRQTVLEKVKQRVELWHEGRRYYLGKNSINEEIAIHFSGPTVLVISNEAGMKRALEQAAKPVTEGAQKGTIGLVETAKSQVIVGLNGETGGLDALKNQTKLFASVQKIQAVRITLDVAEKESTMNVVAQVPDAETAKALTSPFLGPLVLIKATARSRFQEWARNGGEDAATAPKAEKLLDTFKPVAKGNEVSATMKADTATMAEVILYLGKKAQTQEP